MNSSSGTVSGGTRANNTGDLLEQFIEQMLKQKGYIEFWDHKEQVFANRKAVGGKQYAKQVKVGTTVYESDRYCDFLVLNKELFPDGLVIESKWQQSAGSVDEKYPFLVVNIMKTGVPTVVLIDGGGYKKTALAWLKNQVDDRRALIGVWTMADFQKKVNDGFLG